MEERTWEGKSSEVFFCVSAYLVGGGREEDAPTGDFEIITLKMIKLK